MAAVWILRLAYAAGTGLLAIRTAQGLAGPPPRWSTWLRDLLEDAGLSDGEKSAALSDHLGYPAQVATFPGPFTLALLQVKWGRDSGTASPEDDAICTFHFAKIAGGVPVDTIGTDDYTAVETSFLTAWESLRGHYGNHITLRELRWFDAGPDVEAALGGQGRTGPPKRVFQPAPPQGGTMSATLPPQLAISVTEKTSDPKSWGRFYLPAPGVNAGGSLVSAADGRVDPTMQALLSTAWGTFYDECSDNAMRIVVYSQAKAERPAAGGGVLPAVGARALTVDSLQIDDLYDVIRSRRYAQPHSRVMHTVST